MLSVPARDCAGADASSIRRTRATAANPAPRLPFPIRLPVPRCRIVPSRKRWPFRWPGSPATASAVPLTSSGYVSLTDRQWFCVAHDRGDAPLTWPAVLSES